METLTWPLSEPITIFFLVMFLLLLVPIGMQRLKLPGVVGLILTGLILGPNMFNLLERDSTFELFGAVGLQYIVFTAGLELDLAGFNKVKLKSAFFGMISFLIPITVGTFAALTLLNFDLNSAILLGSVFGSHTLLAYPVASRLGLAKHETVTVTVGATLVTDVSALLVLAIIANTKHGDLDAWFWIQLAVGAAIFLALVVVALPRLAKWFFVKRDADGIEAFLFVLASVFAASWIAELTGLVSIIGSFLAGIALNRMIPSTSVLSNRLQFVGNALFIPFFLISVGMLTNLWVLLEGYMAWVISITMSVAVVSTKWAAAQLGGLLLGYSSDERNLMFGLSVPQAAATLATVTVGYKLEFFDDNVLNGTIIMIIVTCLVGPAMVDRAGRQIAKLIASTPPDAHDAPQRLLIPLSNPESVSVLLDMALMARDGLSEQPIYPLVVVDDSEDADARLAAAEGLLANAIHHGASVQVPVQPITRVHKNVSTTMLSAARDTRSSHVIVGWDGRRSRYGHTFGRVLDPVVREGECALLVCHLRQPPNTLAKVVLTLPPFAHRHPGFAQQIHDLKRIVQRIAAPLVVLVPPENAEEAIATIKRAKPTVPLTAHTLPSWSGVLGAVAEQVEEDTLLMLVSARPGTLAFDQNLDHLPSKITRRFEELNLVVSYPAEPALLEAADGPVADDLAISLQTLTFEPALREILDAVPSLPDSARQTLHRAMVKTARRGSTELEPGIVLLDLHRAEIPASVQIVASSAEGVAFPQTREDVKIFLVLLSCAARPSDVHLDRLTRLAAALRRRDQAALLRESPTVERLHQITKG
ncbi:MAG: cation:proton antiporter [Deltaproteobacteria bacterium]|nr:MAG: cation:proton antiporter [Deltaproteobacteria bacterium]